MIDLILAIALTIGSVRGSDSSRPFRAGWSYSHAAHERPKQRSIK